MTPTPFVKRDRGQILSMVAFMAVVLIAMVGLAIDVGRLMVTKAQLVRAVDAAALAGSLKLPDPTAVETEVYRYMAENEPEATVDLPSSPAEHQVQVVAHKQVDLTFLSVLTVIPGIDLEDPVTVSAEAVAGFGVQPVDTYLNIDATGSMGASPCNQSQDNDGCPIKEAKDAAHEFVDILLDDSPGASYTQVGVGPFRGCYNPPRTYPQCVPPGVMVADLTSNEGLLNGKVQDISAQGGTGTNICLGMLKGQEVLFGPNGQTASNTMRFLVILSDGDNTYNSVSYGQGAPPESCRPGYDPSHSDTYVDTTCRSAQTRERSLDTKTMALATTLKSQGVVIYVVGFGVCGTPNSYLCNPSLIGGTSHDNTADRNLLKCIASSTPGTNDRYFEVPDAEDLPDVFSQIAREIAFRLIK
jgi:Putative Flp pilus-assembly TadE/G-like